MRGREQIVAWMAQGVLQREELARLFVEFAGYAAAVVGDDGEIQVYGGGQCACADVLASDHELMEFIKFVKHNNNIS
ncbi:MAG: hypothetical protein HQL77_05290 [Magnetococcales bacterium]|nr:hypothetical protein [Magnetococcales bacterium]